MQVISKVIELLANAAVKIIDGVQARREKRRPKLDPPINVLSIDEAVRRAEAQRAYRKAQGGGNDETK